MVGRVRRVFDGCGFVHWKDLCRPGAVERIEMFLADLREKGYRNATGRGGHSRRINGRTLAYYVRELRGFGDWMVEKKRAATNPLAGVRGPTDAAKDARERRELSAEELRWLLKTTATGKEARFGLEAAERVLLYRFYFETGIRPGQVRQLTAASFDLDAKPPTVTSAARSVKTRRQHTQALRPSTAELLRAHLEGKLPAAPAFQMPDKFHCAEMLRADLAAARAAWIEEAAKDPEEQLKRQRSDFLADVDRLGRRADFYSIRHSHGTELGNAGVPQKDIQASLHHTRSATTDRYVHADLAAKARAVNALPELAIVVAAGGGEPAGEGAAGPASQALAATGTEGITGASAGDGGRMSRACQNGRAPVAFGRVGGGMKNPSPESGEGFLSEGDGARTRNHRIDSPVL